MRWQFVIFAVCLLGCEAKPAITVPAYEPELFRDHVGQLIAGEYYAAAVIYLDSASPEQQARHDGTGFLAVGEDMIVLPGLESVEEYKPARDWLIPGTQDAIQDARWQTTATRFAKQFNLAIVEGSQLGENGTRER
jgi:hypothetical protein